MNVRLIISLVCVYLALLPCAASADAVVDAPNQPLIFIIDQDQPNPDLDSDNDGVPNEEETRSGTDPNTCDTDMDGLSDGVEIGRIEPVDTNGCHGLMPNGTNYRRRHVMDPLNPDSDGDGICDGPADEDVRGCSIIGEDRNGNGWVDPDESDPSITDTDGDGLEDGVEDMGDFDGDQIPDYDFLLIRGGQDCSPPEDLSDVDCDGMPNSQDGDSDNDGCIDSLEGGWLDANGNGLPDVYDNRARLCPEETTQGGGGSPSESPEEEGAGDVLGRVYAGDTADGGACVLIQSQQNTWYLFVMSMTLIFSVFSISIVRRFN